MESKNCLKLAYILGSITAMSKYAVNLDPSKLLYNRNMSALSRLLGSRAIVRSRFWPQEMSELKTLYGKEPGKPFWPDIPTRTKQFQTRDWLRKEYGQYPEWQQASAVEESLPRKQFFPKEKFKNLLLSRP